MQVLQLVKKTTGGKAWLPKWGLHGLTRTQKANRVKNTKQEHQVLSVLKEASRREAQGQTSTGN